MRPMAIVLLLAALAISPVLADDFMPPDWRGEPLTVMAEWDFVTDFNPDRYNIYPDLLQTVGDGTHALGDAVTHAHASETVFWAGEPGVDGVAQTFELPGEIDFFLVNWIDDYEFKHIWIQITYGGQGAPSVSGVNGPNPIDNGWVDPTVGQPLGAFEVAPGQRVEYWLLMPNPDREHIYLHLPPFTWLDQIVFDTISTNDAIAVEAETWSGVKSLFR